MVPGINRKVDLDFYLHRVFRKKSFRPLQRDVILAAVQGHDVFLQASTSFGKSLCFQLPAVVNHGVTVVVSPLLALMTDQVTALQNLEVPVATINSSTLQADRRVILQDLLSGHPRTRLLYVTPELCQTDSFRRNLQKIHSQGELARIAIDEAHCISEWGHDFRPAYKELSWFKRVLPAIPISALTATATPRVRADIINLLGLDTTKLRIFNTPSARPNIHYEIRYLQDFSENPSDPEEFQVKDFVSWLKAIHGRRTSRLSQTPTDSPLPPISGIIYVSLRLACEKVAESLSTAWGNHIRAIAYHAGLSPQDRSRVQSEWTSPYPSPATTNSVKEDEHEQTPAFYIIVATNAFGMGIDNPHVRFVVHWSPPRSFEGFVQESGRAGRDGRAAASVIYYSPQEKDRLLCLLRRDIENAYTRALPTNPHNNNSKSTTKPDPSTRTNNLSNFRNQFARLQSFQKVIRYCEATGTCRHALIREFFGDLELEMMGSQVPPGSSQMMKMQDPERHGPNVINPAGNSDIALKTSPCDFACDFCKEGPRDLSKRKSRMAPDIDLEGDVEGSLEMDMQSLFARVFPGEKVSMWD